MVYDSVIDASPLSNAVQCRLYIAWLVFLGIAAALASARSIAYEHDRSLEETVIIIVLLYHSTIIRILYYHDLHY